MLRKTVFGMMLALLLTGMLTVLLNIQPVKACGTISIRSDGSVDPPTAPISSVDNVTYTFTDNIYDEIVVQRNNIIIDGTGFTLQGTGALNSTGICLSSVSNVTIKKTNIRDFWCGVKFAWSANNAITGNSMTHNDFGIWLHESANNTISRNNVKSGWCGVNLAWSSNNNISGNNVTNNEYGIWLHWSSSNSITGDNVTNNGCGVNLAWSSNNAMIGNNLRSCWCSVRLHGSLNNTITENCMVNNLYGVRLYGSSNNAISGNNVTSNLYGIVLWHSSNNTMYHNNFINNTSQVNSYTSINTWDNGYPSGGNYWSDYTGVDEKGGPYQDQPGSDEIGDIPYIIDADNRDRYPIMRQTQQSMLPISPALLYALLIAVIAIVAGVVFFVVRKKKKTEKRECGGDVSNLRCKWEFVLP